ncbi:MAG: DUF1080 domain-containing protein [Ruminococcaceae bacterium]|nr:DUF1080 domain-containing protein [Oscillospiraceae bacterium]
MGKKRCAVLLTVILLGVIAFGGVNATPLGTIVTENMYGITRPIIAEHTVTDHMYGSQNALLYDTTSTTATDDEPDEEQEIELTEVEGDWLISDTKVITTPQLDDNKATIIGKNYADVEFTASVKVFKNDEKSDAGLIFRTTNATTGQNAFTGYYVGLDAYRDKIVFGRVNNDWTNLATVSMTINANTYYKLSVLAVGNNLKIYVNGVLKANVTDSSPILTAGAIGLRASNTGADYKNISYRTIYPLSVTSGSWSTAYSPVAYSVTQGADDKVSFTGHSYDDLDFTSYVKIGRDDASSDAGLFFRASNMGAGTNAFTGYYVGLNANKDWLLLGRVNNGWTGLRSVNLSINANQWYKLQVKALGNRIQVYLDDVLLIDMVDLNNPILTSGAVGLRANQTSAIYQLVEVNENPFMVPETFTNYTLSPTYGTWSDDNATIPTYSATQGADDKAVLSGQSFGDVKFSTYMKIGRDDVASDAGVIFRASNIGSGTNALTGYYVGMDASQDKLWLGRLNNNWTGVKTVSLTVNKNEYYKVTVEALGANIKVYINDELKINVTDSSPILTAGAIGFRANKTAAWYTRMETMDITPSSDATLSSITLPNNTEVLSPAFDPDITEYSVRVPAEGSGARTIRINVATTDENATVYYSYDPPEVDDDGTQFFLPDLKHGLNTYVLKVVAEDGTVKRYRLHIKRGYYATVNHYYDSGFLTRSNKQQGHDAEYFIQSHFTDAVKSIMLNELGLYLENNISYFSSIPAQCDSIHDNTQPIDGICLNQTHNPRCSEFEATRDWALENYSQNQYHTNAFWIGYSLHSFVDYDATNRSFSWGRNILMQEYNFQKKLNQSISNNQTDEFVTLLLAHELGHQYGAIDHYHAEQTEDEDGRCVNYPICSTCGSDEEKRTPYCIMNSGQKAANGNPTVHSLVFCQECKNEILACLQAYDY